MQTLWERLGKQCERHRAAVQGALVVLVTAAFVGVGSFKGPIKDLQFCASAGERWALLLLLAGLYAAVMGWVVWRKRLAMPAFLFTAGVVLAALYMRVAVFDQTSGDYEFFLKPWVQAFRDHGFRAVAMDIGDYNLPYQYILAGIAALPMHDLYLIKLVSIVFDFALALMVMALTERFLHKRWALVALSAVLLAPTAWFNSAYWAQCDALYVFFVVACLYAMLADRPILSVAMLTVAFAFKIQTIFFFPMVLFGLLHKKYKLRHALVFPVVYLLLIAPALLAGRDFVSALTIYLRQTAQYNDQLTFNAPNIYQFFPMGKAGKQHMWFPVLQYIEGIDPEVWNQWYTKESVGRLLGALVALAGALVLALGYYLYARRRHVALSQVWRLSLAFTLLMPLVLPKMHDRYFYLAECFALLYALREPKRWFVPVLVTGASFASYMPFLVRERTIDMRVAALMMAAAMGVVLWDIVRTVREARRADPACAQVLLEETRYEV